MNKITTVFGKTQKYLYLCITVDTHWIISIFQGNDQFYK